MSMAKSSAFKIRKGQISSFHWVMISFLLLILAGTFLLTLPVCSAEHVHTPFLDCLFEIASAIGTVGLTTGITPLLHTPTKLILIFLMYFGRVGCLTLIYALLPRIKETSRLPMEHINVG